MPNNNDLQDVLQSIKNATELKMQIENVYSDFWGADNSETSDITEKIYYAWADMKEACERYIAYLEDIKKYNQPF